MHVVLSTAKAITDFLLVIYAILNRFIYRSMDSVSKSSISWTVMRFTGTLSVDIIRIFVFIAYMLLFSSAKHAFKD